MAYDKIVDSAALDGALTGIADAIRGKTGSEEKLTLDGMAAAIAGISVGGNDPEVITLADSFTDGLTAYNVLKQFADVNGRLTFLIKKNKEIYENVTLAAAFNFGESPGLYMMVRYRNGATSTALNQAVYEIRANAGDEYWRLVFE